MGTRIRLPLGSVTTSDAGSGPSAAADSGFAILLPGRTDAPRGPFRFRGLCAQSFHFPRAQRLTNYAMEAAVKGEKLTKQLAGYGHAEFTTNADAYRPAHAS